MMVMSLILETLCQKTNTGYVVRHGDHFHYILKQSVGNLAQAPTYRPTPSSNPTGHIYQPTLRPSVPQQQGTTKRQFAGIDYPTK